MSKPLTFWDRLHLFYHFTWLVKAAPYGVSMTCSACGDRNVKFTAKEQKALRKQPRGL